MTAGHRSERRVGPLAVQIAREMLEHEDCPPFLQAGRYRPAVAAWARAEAVVKLLADYLDTIDLREALTELTTAVESEEAGKGSATRRSASKRVASVLSELHRAEVRAMNLRGRLGLDPLTAARLAADLGQARWYGGKTPLEQRLDEIDAERQRAQLEAPDGDG